jgi:general secretion pathway protein C
MLTVLALLAAVSAPPDLAAVGVVLADLPEHSVAILRAGGQARVVAVGDEAFGGRVVSVAADAVALEFDGVRVSVRVSAAAGASLPAPPPPTASSLPSEEEEEEPRVMARAEVQRRLGTEIPRILAETAVRPVTEDGRVVGLKITRVPADSLLTDVGLRVGDVLTSINGTQIDGMATLMSLWPRLQSASDLRADVLRDGHPFSIALSLR